MDVEQMKSMLDDLNKLSLDDKPAKLCELADKYKI